MKFQQKIYRLVKKIPRGKITTYKELAEALNSRAYQAVGQALKRNPNPIKVPCHRVIRSNGELGGYSGPGSRKKKKRLLEREGIEIRSGRIDLDKHMHTFSKEQ